MGAETPVTGAGFVDTKMAAGSDSDYNVFLRSTLAYFLPQFLHSVTLKADGNIQAEYSTGPIMIDGKSSRYGSRRSYDEYCAVYFFQTIGRGVTNDDVTVVIKDRTYYTSPTNLVYWYPKDGQIRIKLNLPAIITVAMKGQGKVIDENLLASLTDIILKMDPIALKGILIKINGTLQNDIIKFIYKPG